MRLPQLSKTQKKIAIGAGAGVALATTLWLAFRPKKQASSGTGTTTVKAAQVSMAQGVRPPVDPANRIVDQGTRVIVWPASSNKNGMAYIKFVDGQHVRGGWIEDNAVLRDSEVSPQTQYGPVRSLSGLGAGAIQQQPAQQAATNASPNGVILKTSLMFVHPEDKGKLATLTKQYFDLMQVVASGGVLLIPDEDTFRAIYTHGGTRVLDVIPPIFYKDGKFTKNNLANHSWCQTWAAQVVGFGNDYLWPFYNQSVYRYGPNVTPDVNLDRYPNSPIDPVKDNAAFEAALNAAIEADIQNAMRNSSFGDLLSQIEQIMGSPAFTLLFGKDAPRGVYFMKVSPDEKAMLAQFGLDFATDNDTTKNMLPTEKSKLLDTINGVVDGQQKISGDGLNTVRSSAGSLFVRAIISMFESHDPKVNPCIREENFDLYLGILIAVVSAFLTVVSLGSAGFFGPVIQAVYWSTYSLPSAIKGIADLSK